MAKRTMDESESLRAASPAAGPLYPVTRLDQVVGHDRAKSILERSMRSGRVHHAWIFHGPIGVGKFTTALSFAASILDPTTAPDLSGRLAPEELSTVQQLARAGTHPDLKVVTKELAAVSRDDVTRSGKQITLPIEVIREFVVEPASKSRTLGGGGVSLAGRVFIIDEAELMDQRTQNVLLKIVEEPPEGCVIILVTSSEDRLLTTLRSRSQRVGFLPLSEAEMIEWLGASGLSIGERERAWLLRFAGGAPGLVKLAIEHGLHQWEEQLATLLDDAARGVYSPELGSTMARLVGERAEAAIKGRPDASKDAANKAWARRMLGFVADRARMHMRAGHTEASRMAWSLHALDVLGEAESHLASNVNLGLLLDNLAAQLARQPAEIV